jgi:hypothetical protein
MITVLADGVTRLADNDFGDNLGDGVAGPVGLLIIVLLAIATALLIRNMNKHLKRLPESFPDPRAAARAADQAESTDDSELSAVDAVPVPGGDTAAPPS